MKKIVVGLVTTPLTSGHAVRGVGMYTKFLLEKLESITRNLRLGVYEIIRVTSTSAINSDLKILHYPFFDLFFPTLNVPKAIPTVVTIHDVTPLRFPKQYPPGLRGGINFFRQKLALKRVSAIITDSNASKSDIESYLGVDEKKIFVVPLAPQVVEFPPKNSPGMDYIKQKYHLPEKFVLFVGDVNWNKNLINLVSGAKLLGLPVVIVGKQAIEENLLQSKNKEHDSFRVLISLYGRDKDVIRTGFVPEGDLAAIYTLATVYCQPSLWEGFGMSCLEAAAAGCPVVASEIEPLTELLGEGAIYIDPENVRSIADGIKRAMSLKTKSKIVPIAKKRSHLYTWEKTAMATLLIYKKFSL